MNKKELAASRDATYRVPAGNRCGLCKHGWFRWASDHTGQCHLVVIRDRIIGKDVSIYGVCDHFEPKEKA